MAKNNLNARFRRSIIRDLMFEVRVFTRLNPALAMQAEASLLTMAERRNGE